MSDNQLELNQKLHRLLYERHIDLEQIELALKEGADPMGSPYENDPDEHIYGEILCECLWDEFNPHFPDMYYPELMKSLPELTRLFVKYGMKIECDPEHPFEDNNSNPLWNMFFSSGVYTIEALRILLDNGLSAEVFEDFVEHAYIDMELCYGHVGEDFEANREDVDWPLKMIFLAASYPHIINNSEYIRECIACDENDYDLTRFRNWDDFVYEYDLSTAYNLHHGLKDVKVSIKEADTGKVIWNCVI